MKIHINMTEAISKLIDKTYRLTGSTYSSLNNKKKFKKTKA